MSRGDPHPDSRFAADWLALRESADAAARSLTLTEAAAGWLAARDHRPLACVDLGSGSGSNPRYLARRLPGPQQWRLIDHDAELLARALHACSALHDASGKPVALRTEQRDLGTLGETDLLGTDLLSASALIDILGAEGLERIATVAVRSGAAVLFSLSVDGEWSFHRGATEDIDPGDALAREAFNAHQRRDKGVGGALGPDAHDWLATRLRAAGYRVLDASSPWRLRMNSPQEALLARALLEGWLHAALEQLPSQAQRLRDWHARRLAALGDPEFRIRVGHRDLLALPASGTGHPA